MSAPTLYVDLGTDGRQLLLVSKADGTAEDISGCTRAVISGADLAADIDSNALSEGAGAVFDWATAGVSGVLVMHLSAAAVGLTAGNYSHCTLTLHDANSPNGVRCRTTFHLVVS